MADTYVVTGAMMTCTFGMAPSSLVVLPSRTDMLGNMPRANIMDFTPMVNIMPFGMCTTPSNPTVAAATSAAMGVLTPMPCIPAVTTPWMPGKAPFLVQGQPALTRTCCNMCMWGGQITFSTDGQHPGIPPVVVPPANVQMPDLQPEWMMLNSEPSEVWNYKYEFEQAKYAGDGDRAIADQLNEMAGRYMEEGQIDKASQALQASEQYRQRADEKQAAAMQAVNDKYVWKGHAEEQETGMSREELQGIQDQANRDQAEYDKEINRIDKQLAKTKNEEKREQLIEQREAAVANRDAAEQRAASAQQAMEAQDVMDKHQEAIDAHEAAKVETREKREEMNAFKKEEQINRDEADAWFHVGQVNKENGKQETADKVFEKSNEYDLKANEAHRQSVEKEKEWNESKRKMGEAKENAYGDDAMLDTYSANLKYDQAMNDLKNNSGK